MYKFVLSLLVMFIIGNRIVVIGPFIVTTVYNLLEDLNPEFPIPGYAGKLIFFRGKSIKAKEPESADHLSCQEKRGELAIVDTLAKQEIAVNMMDHHHGGKCFLRIGLLRKGNRFVWRDGTPLGKPTYWAPGEPKSSTRADCIYMTRCSRETGLKRWHTIECHRFDRLQLCQWDKSSPTSPSTRSISTSTHSNGQGVAVSASTKPSEVMFNTNNYDTNDESEEELKVFNSPIKLAAGIGFLVIFIVIVIVIYFCRKSKRKELHYDDLYESKSGKSKSNYYYYK